MERETTHPLWDREGAYNRLLNDEALLQKMMQMFLDNVEKAMSVLELALSQKDIVSIKAHAHKLKGSASAVGALRVVDDCTAIEEAANANDIDRVESKMSLLKNDISDIQLTMTDYLNHDTT
jgi:HPt (histidine-containing phosphotransfer) domain-containing protein